jgi:hypothetical protein
MKNIIHLNLQVWIVYIMARCSINGFGLTFGIPYLAKRYKGRLVHSLHYGITFNIGSLGFYYTLYYGEESKTFWSIRYRIKHAFEDISALADYYNRLEDPTLRDEDYYG